jgi:hypothetical protein
MTMIPRAADGAKLHMIKGDTWNIVADACTRVLNMTAADPLTMLNTPAGISLGAGHDRRNCV